MSDDAQDDDGMSPTSASVFELLVIFFSCCCSAAGLLFVAFRTLKNHQAHFIKIYHLEAQRYVSITKAVDVAWSSLAWFSVSISFTIFNKWIMQLWEGGFEYPITMTTLHMLLKVLITRIYMFFTGVPVPPLQYKTTLQIVVPIGVLTATDIMLSNMSIPLIPLSLYTALKTTVPVWSFVLAILYKLEPFRWATFFSIAALVGGLALAVEFRIDGSMTGIALVLCASLSGALRWVLTQVLLETDAASKDVMVAIYRFSPASFLFLLPIALYFEAGDLYASKFVQEQPELGWKAFFFSVGGGVISIALIGFEIYILRATTAVTLGMIGQFKEIMQILLSLAIYNEHLSWQTGVGLSVSVIAANFYRLIKSGHIGGGGNQDNSTSGSGGASRRNGDRGNRGASSTVEMAMRKNRVDVDEYNPLRGFEGDYVDEDLTAGLDVFLEVDSDGEGEFDDDLYVF